MIGYHCGIFNRANSDMTDVSWVTVGILTVTTIPIWGTLAWEIWEGFIKPTLIPAHEIDALVAECVSRYGEDAADIAFMNADRAWRYCNSFEQGKWRRVRRQILRGSL